MLIALGFGVVQSHKNANLNKAYKKAQAEIDRQTKIFNQAKLIHDQAKETLIKIKTDRDQLAAELDALNSQPIPIKVIEKVEYVPATYLFNYKSFSNAMMKLLDKSIKVSDDFSTSGDTLIKSAAIIINKKNEQIGILNRKLRKPAFYIGVGPTLSPSGHIGIGLNLSYGFRIEL